MDNPIQDHNEQVQLDEPLVQNVRHVPCYDTDMSGIVPQGVDVFFPTETMSRDVDQTLTDFIAEVEAAGYVSHTLGIRIRFAAGSPLTMTDDTSPAVDINTYVSTSVILLKEITQNGPDYEDALGAKILDGEPETVYEAYLYDTQDDFTATESLTTILASLTQL
jgi:hypothetical protein